jgi:hypothetical protein
MRSARPFLWSILVLGVIMIVLPFAISLPSRASHGQTMIDQFRPIMRPASVATTTRYYDQVFVSLRGVATGGVQAAGEVPALISGLAHALHHTRSQTEQFLSSNYPAMAGLLISLPKLTPVFSQVPAGLDHYLPLVRTMRANVVNFAEISALPNFRLFTWFFVIPGVLMVLLAGIPLLRARSRAD